MHLAATGIDMHGGQRRITRRIAAAIAVSLAVHTLILSGWRGAGRAPDVQPAPARPLAIRVQPPPPAPAPAPAPAPPLRSETPPPAAAAKAPARPATPRKPRPLIAVPPEPAAPPAPEPFVVEQAPASPPPDTPRFDLDAARKTARSLANLRDPARAGTAVAQFPEKPLETESRAARAIGGAKRRNCKDGMPGGLLAPLLMLADKKNSGCKW